MEKICRLNFVRVAVDLMDEMPDMGDEADAPIIVPPPGQILRRAARTKIRKPGLPGDGGGHRFGASRRGAGAKSVSTPPAEPRTSSEMSSSDHGEADSSLSSVRRPFSDEGAQNVPRPDSYSEETSIYDAYARDDDEDSSYPPVIVSPLQEPHPLPIADEPPQIPIEVVSTLPEKPVAHIPPQPTLVLHQPQPQHLSVPMSATDQGPPARTPSPQRPIVERPTPVYTPPSILPTTHNQPAQSRKEKDKKSLFGKWGGDKGGKRGSKEKERENRERAEKEKESGFFGSLFGKKKQESEYQSSITGGTAGREAAQALLGASKSSKSYVPPTSPGLAPGIGGNPYARYPIHVERAIYRLSHIKLANPRRPLYEQVLISNLMFWYLGVINKAQNSSPNPTQATTNGTTNPGGTTGESQDHDEQEQREKEQREKEQREKEQREKAEKERLEKEQREREREMELKKKESGRRGSLTKTPVGGSLGGRRAEMPIKGPQYEMQHRVMEQEYGGYNGQPPRSPTFPPANGPPGQLVPRAPPPGSYTNGPPKSVLPQQKLPAEQYYYQSQNENHHRPALPPGAMPPADQSAWNNQTPSPLPPQQRLTPGPHRRSRSPPSQQHNHHPPQKQPMQIHKISSQENLGERAGHRGPSRSMSATPYSSPNLPPPNGALRKGNSASVVPLYDKRPNTSEGQSGANGEEEDVPLAVWQQQRRK